jgi:hypothetical protein
MKKILYVGMDVHKENIDTRKILLLFTVAW